MIRLPPMQYSRNRTSQSLETLSKDLTTFSFDMQVAVDLEDAAEGWRLGRQRWLPFNSGSRSALTNEHRLRLRTRALLGAP